MSSEPDTTTPAPASAADGPKKKGGRGPLVVTLIIVVIAGGAVLWHKKIRHQLFPKNFGVVAAGSIYRSGQNTPRVLRTLCDDLHIKTIIDLGGMSDDDETVAERGVAAEKGVKRYEFGLSGDGTGDPDKWAAVVRLLADERNHPVLVHCHAGAQRSSTAVMLYRHLVEGKPISDVYPETFDYKHKPDEWILLAFVADHLDEITTAYRVNRPGGDASAPTVDAFADGFIVNGGGS